MLLDEQYQKLKLSGNMQTRLTNSTTTSKRKVNYLSKYIFLNNKFCIVCTAENPEAVDVPARRQALNGCIDEDI